MMQLIRYECSILRREVALHLQALREGLPGLVMLACVVCLYFLLGDR